MQTRGIVLRVLIGRYKLTSNIIYVILKKTVRVQLFSIPSLGKDLAKFYSYKKSE